jgi:fumarate hydratase class II
MPLDIIHAIAGIKLCAAKTNADCKKMDKKFLIPIVNACNVILSGKLDKQFPLKVWQTGSGTQTNMNVNEVIANYVKKHNKLVIHPNDHINMSQSTNDVFPSAIHIACCLSIKNKLLPQVKLMIEQLKKLEKQTSSIIKIGRTHLQDATPILLSQEIKS